jgi:phage shock protein PspC (stress-responsive transcriptional regulator)
MNQQRQITRSSTDRMLGGVCGGIAQYLGVDSTLVRLGFVLLTFAGVSPLLYLILWIVMPSDTTVSGSWTQQVQQTMGEIQERASTVAREVSTQVQKVTNSGNQSNPSASRPDDQQEPSTGPTTRL